MAKKPTLGRGIDVLIPKDLDPSLLGDDQQRIQKLLITDIVPASDQPRQQWDNEALRELTLSIKSHGVLQPIIVVRSGDSSSYRIVAGERRWRAARAAGLKQIPSIIRSLKELEEVELALIENIQRVDLSPLEQALAVYKLQHQFSQKLESIAEKLGKAPSTISNLIRLLQLPEAAQTALREGSISEGHARAILALSSMPDEQNELLRCILNNKWTVRQAEQFAIRAKSGISIQTKPVASYSNESDKKVADKLRKKLATDVSITRRKKGGRLVVDFASDEQLADLVKKLSS